MRIRFRELALGLAVLTSGCSDTARSVSVTSISAPHRGTLIPLPEDKGFIELLNEPEVDDRRNPQPTSIVAYFLQPDGKAPLLPAPSSVSFAIENSAGKGRQAKTAPGGLIALSVEPKPDDPLAASRFASKPGPFDLAALRGTLTTKIGAQEISSVFGGSR